MMLSVQSPIAISMRSSNYVDHLPLLEYHGHWTVNGNAYIENTGISAVLTIDKCQTQPFICGGPLPEGIRYIFEQMHFHWSNSDEYGCEHSLDGHKYSMEAHAVHFNEKYKNFNNAINKRDGLAVVAFFIQANGEIDFNEFNNLINGIKQIRKPNRKFLLDSNCLSWMALQELNKHYYTYKGSLTTEPYHESVTWIIYRTPIYVSKQQVSTFRNLQSSSTDKMKKIQQNFRNIQVTPKQMEPVIFVRNYIKLKSKL